MASTTIASGTPARGPARNISIGGLFELFLVASIAAILVIRFFLTLTGFPQLGSGGLHIAHMLWGGLFMLVALILLLGFLGQRTRYAAALLGGIGFGTFIDELGKFITSDNNYFFQPTIALIYIIFIILFLIFRWLSAANFSQRELLANALEESVELVIREPREDHREEALRLVQDSGVRAPLAQGLAQGLARTYVSPPLAPGPLARMNAALRNGYRGFVRSSWFASALVILFVAYGVLSGVVLILFVTGVGVGVGAFSAQERTGFAQTATLVFSALADLLIIAGLVSLPRSRMLAYQWFKAAMLVSIFFVQVFAFYLNELSALGGLLINLVILSALNYMIAQERGTPASPRAQEREPAG